MLFRCPAPEQQGRTLPGRQPVRANGQDVEAEVAVTPEVTPDSELQALKAETPDEGSHASHDTSPYGS
jgi:hypothetical protein